MNDKEKNQRLTELDIEKRELEINKLKQEQEKIGLEIKELSKSNFRKTNWWSITIPLLFSVVPAVYLLMSGIFDIKYQEYKTSKASLEFDQKKFTEIKNSIETRIAQLKDSMATIDKLFNSKRDSLESFKQILFVKQDSLFKLSSNIKNYQKNILDLEMTKNSLVNGITEKDKLVGDILKQKLLNEKKMSDSLWKLKIIKDSSTFRYNGLEYLYKKQNSFYATKITDLNSYIQSYKTMLNEKDEKIKKLENELNLLKKPS